MFMDDVLCTGEGKIFVCVYFHKIFREFNKAYGLIMNQEKKKLIFDSVDSSMMIEIVDMFGVKIRSMSGSFKYIGYILKANKCSIFDWD